MKISEHADRTERLVGIRAEDIHKWIDGFFDREGFDDLLRSGRSPDYDPYDHRRFRHCQDAIADACAEFAGKYTAEQVRAVFECHVRDDYDGYFPHREDFENGTFTEKYHENDEQAANDRILSTAELTEYFRGRVYSRRRTETSKEQNAFLLRIVLPTIVAIVLFITSVLVFVIPFFRSSVIERKKEMIRELTTAAASVVGSYATQHEQGALPLAEAQKLALSQVQGMRYGPQGKDYFWVTDMHPKVVMHPYRPDLVGKDLTKYADTRDTRSRQVFVEFARIVREKGAGYSEYTWQWMDDPSRDAPKLSYVMAVPGWGWIIGTGVYLDDVQAEIGLLTRRLTAIFVVLGLLLAGMLLTVVWQSRRIENHRLQAEFGLHEAKERYRALVEASKEGYILHVDGQCVYSNGTLQRMLGLSPEQLAAKRLPELLAPEGISTEAAQQQLARLASGEARPGSFDAQLVAASGGLVDVVVSISKIFFAQKNGYVLSFRPAKPARVRSLLESVVGPAWRHTDRSELLRDLRESRSVGQVVHLLNRLSLLFREMADQGVRPGLLRHAIGQAFDASVNSLVQVALEKVGDPPVAFAFLALGSNARHEMTMSSDQDNALVFADVSASDKDCVTRYFLKLASKVCSELNDAGFAFCPGGIMASNPKWCLPLSEWKSHFGEWVADSDPSALLDFNVFFDIHCVYGDQGIAHELTEHIHQLTAERHAFFMQLSRNCLLYKVPVELLSARRLSKQSDQTKTSLNLKACLKPLEVSVRIQALKHQVSERGTIARLRKLEELGALPQEVVDETVYIFDYLWRMRFYNQILSDADLKSSGDDLDLRELTEVERQNLAVVLQRLKVLQQKLCAEFLGMPLHMVPV